ncbi:MAG: hypothetical protein VB050_03960 [Geobacteraceae bacterium]|nr:hypothetical protein [Geobacteraceae bacterium]
MVNHYTKAKRSGQGFDAVIMDFTIQEGMGGKEAMALLLEADSNVTGIVSSGYNNDPILPRFTNTASGVS